MKPHFLQSDIWIQFQKEIGKEIVENSGNGWSYFALISKDRFGKYLYVPYGPHAENKEALIEAVDDLKVKAKKLGAYVVCIEPVPPFTKDEMSKLFKHRGYHRQAHRTILIDLSPSEDEIIAQMHKTRRKQHRNYQTKGISIEKSNTPETLEIFYDLLKKSSGEKSFYVREKSFFEQILKSLVPKNGGNFFIAKLDGKIEVAALVYDDEDTRYYAHVGRDLTDNSLQASAPLISYMIIDAKRAGKKYFDLYGISESDEVPDEKSGFTIFKKTFGGQVKNYAGAWEIPIKKATYNIKNKLKKFIK